MSNWVDGWLCDFFVNSFSGSTKDMKLKLCLQIAFGGRSMCIKFLLNILQKFDFFVNAISQIYDFCAHIVPSLYGLNFLIAFLKILQSV